MELGDQTPSVGPPENNDDLDGSTPLPLVNRSKITELGDQTPPVGPPEGNELHGSQPVSKTVHWPNHRIHNGNNGVCGSWIVLRSLWRRKENRRKRSGEEEVGPTYN